MLLSTHLPIQVLREVSAGRVKRILWASYGDKTGSWFFTCELRNGASAFEVGPDTPRALRAWIQQLDGSHLLLSALRVQLGDNDSFVVWSRTAWACANVPRQLQAKL
jgi:methylenetetrahydrofolate dehydrogenase (NADP+)/methenyltetrahydrofolate cyclohydrolase/formyltetrahydrofolate synthetase